LILTVHFNTSKTSTRLENFLSPNSYSSQHSQLYNSTQLRMWSLINVGRRRGTVDDEAGGD